MKARELRIGNLISDIHSDNGFWPVKEIRDLFCIYGEHGFKARHKDIKPIPLTEEWLIRFGFEKLKGKKNESCFANADLNFGNPVLKINNYTSLCANGGNKYLFLDGFRIPCKHVHELQNLFFALTGTELELKTKTT